MIQRIQTIYLIGVVILTSLYIFVPFSEYSLTNVQYVFSISGLETISHTEAEIPSVTLNTFPLIIINMIIALVSAISIWSYKKRVLQIRLGRFNLLLNTLLVVLIFFDADQLALKTTVNPDYKLGMLLPVIAILFTFLANRAIRKDEELVRSTDRLR